MNVVVIRGRLSSEPVVRALASGSTLLSMEVTSVVDAANLSVPVAWFDPKQVPEWAAGTEVVVCGVVRRRFFRTGAVTQSRTEVVANEVVEWSRRRQVAKLVERHLAMVKW